MRLKVSYLVLLVHLLMLLLLTPNVSTLVKKNRLWCKDIEGKYLTIFDYNKFANNILDAKVIEKK